MFQCFVSHTSRHSVSQAAGGGNCRSALESGCRRVG